MIMIGPKHHVAYRGGPSSPPFSVFISFLFQNCIERMQGRTPQVHPKCIPYNEDQKCISCMDVESLSDPDLATDLPILTFPLLD